MNEKIQIPAIGSEALPYFVLTTSHKTAPVEIRECLAIPASDLPGFLGALKVSGIANEVVVLSTCNRTEIYAVSDEDPAVIQEDLGRFLVQHRNFAGPIRAFSRGFSGRAEVVHGFRVISSLDSLVLGETGIVQQFSEAYAAARQAGTTGRWLNRYFQTAQAVNKAVRSGTSIQEGNASVAGLAAQSAAHGLGTLLNAKVLVVGAGETAETAARALKRHGARQFVVTNRSAHRAEALAGIVGGTTVPFESWPSELGTADVVIVATAAPGWLLTHPVLREVRGGSTRTQIVLDLSVPRNVEPYCASLAGVTVLDVDSLNIAVTQAALLREGQRPLAESIIADKTAEFLEHLERARRYLDPLKRSSEPGTDPAGDSNNEHRPGSQPA